MMMMMTMTMMIIIIIIVIITIIIIVITKTTTTIIMIIIIIIILIIIIIIIIIIIKIIIIIIIIFYAHYMKYKTNALKHLFSQYTNFSGRTQMGFLELIITKLSHHQPVFINADHKHNFIPQSLMYILVMLGRQALSSLSLSSCMSVM